MSSGRGVSVSARSGTCVPAVAGVGGNGAFGCAVAGAGGRGNIRMVDAFGGVDRDALGGGACGAGGGACGANGGACGRCGSDGRYGSSGLRGAAGDLDLDFESAGFLATALDLDSAGFLAGDFEEPLLRLRSVVVFLGGGSFLGALLARAFFFSTSLCTFSLWAFIFSSSRSFSLAWLSCSFLIFSDWISFEFRSISNLLSSKILVRSDNLLPFASP